MPISNEPVAPRSAAGPWALLLVLGIAGYGVWKYVGGFPPAEVTEPPPAEAGAEATRVGTFATNPADPAKPGQSKESAQAAKGPGAGGAASATGGRSARTAPNPEPVPAGSSTPPGASIPAPVAATKEPERATSSSGPPTSTTSSEIYGPDSAGVKSPVLITPGANTPLLTGVRHPPGTPGIEILVNPDGFVGSVKAVTKPISLAESLEYHNGLSVAKSWQFQPALRDGQPVKYRLFIPLAILRARSAVK